MKISAPGNDTLWAEYGNKIILRIKGKNKIASVKLLGGGTVLGKDSTYTIRVDTGSAVVLVVYEKVPGDKPKICFSKKYKILKIPAPVAYVCGIKADSTADKLDLIYQNNIKLWSAFYKRNFNVLSYTMYTYENDKIDSLSAEGDKLTDLMRQNIHRLKAGAVLYFEKITYMDPCGKMKELRPVAIYIDETNKYKVGERKIGK